MRFLADKGFRAICRLRFREMTTAEFLCLLCLFGILLGMALPPVTTDCRGRRTVPAAAAQGAAELQSDKLYDGSRSP